MTNVFNETFEQYAEHGIKVDITAKKVKNINFRLKPLNPTDEPPFTTLMTVSYPVRLPKNALIQSLQNRLNWAIDCQNQQIERANTPPKLAYYNDLSQIRTINLESEVYFLGEKWRVMDLMEDFYVKKSSKSPALIREFKKHGLAGLVAEIYRQWLIEFINERQDFWQGKVGKSAVSITPYRMKTRWGSCSTQAKTIRLSIWLAQFPPSCADYVLVHELCHLHEANHSARFWGQVAKAMPDYQIWHNLLKGGLGDDM